jgi:hypothetical protein
MELKKLYTAVGRLEREANGCGHSCPVGSDAWWICRKWSCGLH